MRLVLVLITFILSNNLTLLVGQLNGEMLAWLSACSEVQMICVWFWLMPLPPYHVLLH